MYNTIRKNVNSEPWMPIEFEKDLASVIITTYQRDKYIIKTVDSVFRQSYRPIELIVIDDGSTDSTKELIESWGNTLPNDSMFRLHYVYQQNQGAPSARNLALKFSKGEFIQEIGSDDLIHPDKLLLHIESLKTNLNCKSAWSPLLRFENNQEDQLFSETLPVNVLLNTIKIYDQSENLFIPEFMPSAGLHRRSVFVETGPWHEKLQRWQDLEYQVRMAFCIKKYTLLYTPLYYFRQHNDGRIHSMYKQKSGIESGFLSLELIQETLENKHYHNKEVNIEISKFYISLANLAAEYSLKEEFKKAVKLAIKFRSNLKFTLKMNLYYLAVQSVGFRFARNAMQNYLRRKNQ